MYYMIDDESTFQIRADNLNKSSRSEIFQQTIRTEGFNQTEFQNHVSVWTEYLELQSPN